MPKIPMQFAFLVPRGYPTPYDEAAAFAEVERWIHLCQDWFEREIGMRFNYVLYRVDAIRDIYALSAGGLDGCTKAAIPEGEGGSYVMANLEVSIAFQKLGVRIYDSQRRGIVQVGAGGFAGTIPPSKKVDVGNFLLGDWELAKGVTGNPAPCNPWPALQPGRSFGHELLHACGVDADAAPAYFTGDTLTPTMRRALKSSNRAFLY